MPDQFVGAPIRRVEDNRLLRGAGKYVDDLQLPGLLHLAFVRSPHPKARIVRLDTHAARQTAGVAAVWTNEDTRPFQRSSSSETESPELHLLAHETVHVVGQPVAVVAATDRYGAEDAAGQVEVDYEPLASVSNMEEALRPGAPLVHDVVGTNLAYRLDLQNGDVASAFESADQVVSLKILHPRLAAVPIEPRGVVAHFDAATDELTVWLSTQAPHRARTALASAVGLPENRIRVIAPDVGGGFGVKGPVYREEIIATLLSRQLGRPIKWVATRGEDFLATFQGRGMVSEVSAAVRADGRLLGLKAQVIADLGAEPVSRGTTPPQRVSRLGRLLQGAYDVDNVRSETLAVYTNTPTIGAYRGSGRPEVAYAIERLMDEVARAVGLDPAEVRRRNFIQPEQFPFRNACGVVYDSGDYGRALDKVLEIAKYDELRQEQAAARANGEIYGVGLSTFVEPSGGGGWESGQVRVEPSAKVTAATGSSPHGQGHETAFAQIVADRLGVSMDDVVVRHGDTALGPPGVGTSGSRSAILGGNAISEAAQRVAEKARRLAAYRLEAAPEDIQLANGRLSVLGAPDRSLGWNEVAATAYGRDGLPPGEELGLEATVFFQGSQEAFGFGAHLAVVRIDPESGQVHLVRYVAVDDCGRQINPLLVEGQVHGGLAQGIGQALLEEVVFDDSGQMLTGTLLDYALPRASHVPELLLDHTVTLSPLNPLGVKGVGEAGTVGAPPAIVNAVVDALSPYGVRHLDMPLTPEKVRRAILRQIPSPLEKG